MQLRRHQAGALAAVETAWGEGERRALVVLPPGAGKTLVGLESVRRLAEAGEIDKGVVLGPNTAIQAQWAVQGRDLGLDTGTDRDLATLLTALTYQSVAVFDADDEVDDDGLEADTSLLGALHDNGKALVGRLRAAGPILLVLDECHHLLEVWGRLLEEVLDLLPQARVLALTATPPEALTREQAALADRLFGRPLYAASIPAVVREGDLAPFAELVWLTEPTATETAWLAEGATRFRELTTQLVDPAFGDPAFLVWLDRRFVTRPGDVGWPALTKDQPELTDAALRMHHAGLLALPPGARPEEQHRREPDADDWMVLVEAWLDEQGDDAAAADVDEAVRRALPAVGFVRTRHGIRRGRTPVDRVLARSESKTTATVEIAAREHDDLGDTMRLLVLCDHERASATLPADLEGVLAAQSGSALAVLDALLGSDAGADAMLVTGRTVAGTPETLAALVAHVAETDPERAATLVATPRPGTRYAVLEGRWSSRTWVRFVTSFFESGGTHVLVGTRGLLGEGWDARSITGLVDLTAITTTTAVVQTRGRALRTDPARPDKVALNWSVVCVAEDHPRGDNDWKRLVRKHTGFFGVDADGEVVDGVGHLDPAFSPYAAPPVTAFAEINGRMTVRAQDRAGIRDRWRVGTPYDDRPAAALRIRPSRRVALGTRTEMPVVVQQADRLEVRGDIPRRLNIRPAVIIGGGAAVVCSAAVLSGGGPVLVPIVLALMLIVGIGGSRINDDVKRGRMIVAAASDPPSVDQVARVVADALFHADLVSSDAGAVRIEVDDDGTYRCVLGGVPEDESRLFATSLDEALSPIGNPRYVLPRWVVIPGEVGWRRAMDVSRSKASPAGGVVWHPVPTVLGTHARRAGHYAWAWDRWIGGGKPVYTGSPEGAGILAAQSGADPFEVSTAMRRTWS